MGHRIRAGRVRRLLALFSVGSAVAVSVMLAAIPAFAGQAATGELFFYPCTSCHPVAEGAVQSGRKLPNDFKGHAIALAKHDELGQGSAACLVCHDGPAKNPGKLKLIDGTLIDITGDVSLVCFRCHSAKYREWKAGTHGRRMPKCTSAGCHDPHTPGWIYARPLLPFVGGGFQFQVLSVRQPFMPLASPSPAPPTHVPTWFYAVAALGVAVAAGIAGKLILGRSKR